MSQVITPPEIDNKDTVYLIVNADVSDIEMVVRWLKIHRSEYTIYLYHDGMDNVKWLKEVSAGAQLILANVGSTDLSTNSSLEQFANKLKWIGSGQTYPTATEYLIKNG